MLSTVGMVLHAIRDFDFCYCCSLVALTTSIYMLGHRIKKRTKKKSRIYITLLNLHSIGWILNILLLPATGKVEKYSLHFGEPCVQPKVRKSNTMEERVDTGDELVGKD